MPNGRSLNEQDIRRIDAREWKFLMTATCQIADTPQYRMVLPGDAAVSMRERVECLVEAPVLMPHELGVIRHHGLGFAWAGEQSWEVEEECHRKP